MVLMLDIRGREHQFELLDKNIIITLLQLRALKRILKIYDQFWTVFPNILLLSDKNSIYILAEK